MTQSELAGQIKERFGYDSQLDQEIKILVDPGDWKPVAQFLKDSGLDYFSFMTATDKRETFVLLTRVENLSGKIAVHLSCRLDSNGKIESLAGLWAGADWMEREIFDLFGIEFEGHPHLKRILLPEEYQGFPLRKEFPLDQRYEPYR